MEHLGGRETDGDTASVCNALLLHSGYRQLCPILQSRAEDWRQRLWRSFHNGFVVTVSRSSSHRQIGRRYLVRGRVQGVGFRDFVQRRATELGVSGYTRNLDDGRVEVLAVGTERQLSDLAGYLYQGPRWADVRGVEEQEAPMLQCRGFEIRH